MMAHHGIAMRPSIGRTEFDGAFEQPVSEKPARVLMTVSPPWHEQYFENLPSSLHRPSGTHGACRPSKPLRHGSDIHSDDKGAGSIDTSRLRRHNCQIAIDLRIINSKY
ncbi:hypothetical protein [Rhizobium croatiense]|uniref:hypothetical protein n=1 Tax=Rhizobium croatiense TaxID=2867516 RepID=UPI0035E3E82F